MKKIKNKKFTKIFLNIRKNLEAYFASSIDLKENFYFYKKMIYELPGDYPVPKDKKLARELWIKGQLFDMDGYSYITNSFGLRNIYILTLSGRINRLIKSKENMLILEDIESKNIWKWEDLNRRFPLYIYK